MLTTTDPQPYKPTTVGEMWELEATGWGTTILELMDELHKKEAEYDREYRRIELLEEQVGWLMESMDQVRDLAARRKTTPVGRLRSELQEIIDTCQADY